MKKSAVVLILVLVLMLGACGKVEIDPDLKNADATVSETGYDFSTDSFMNTVYDGYLSESESVVSDGEETIADDTDRPTTSVARSTTAKQTTSKHTTSKQTTVAATQAKTENKTEASANLVPTAPDLSRVMELLELEHVAGSDANEQIKAQKMLKDYFSYYGDDVEIYSLGKCKGIESDYYISGGYAFITEMPTDDHVENFYYYVIPEKDLIYLTYVDSEIYLVWKDGTAADGKKATAFFESVMGELYDDYEYLGRSIDGTYEFAVYGEGGNPEYFVVNWECDKIYMNTMDDIYAEVYPNDEVGIFL